MVKVFNLLKIKGTAKRFLVRLAFFVDFFALGIAPLNAQLEQDKIRDLGVRGLSHEQRCVDLARSVNAQWDHLLESLKEFSDDPEPKLVLEKLLRKPLRDLKTSAKELKSPNNIRQDVNMLSQEITKLHAYLVSEKKVDLATKTKTLSEKASKLVEELDVIGQTCDELISDSNEWEKDYDLSIQVQGADKARKEMKNQADKAIDKVEKMQEKHARDHPVSLTAPPQNSRPDLRTLSTDKLKTLANEESTQDVPDRAWLKEIVAELKVRLLRTRELEESLDKKQDTTI